MAAMKLKLFVIFTLIILLPINIYYKKQKTIVTNDGMIKKISLDDKTLKIEDIPEREYRVPDTFICDNTTVIYKFETSGELVRISFENLKVKQKITKCSVKPLDLSMGI